MLDADDDDDAERDRLFARFVGQPAEVRSLVPVAAADRRVDRSVVVAGVQITEHRPVSVSFCGHWTLTIHIAYSWI